MVKFIRNIFYTSHLPNHGAGALHQWGIGNPYGRTVRLSSGGYGTGRRIWAGFGRKRVGFYAPYQAFGIFVIKRYRGTATHISCGKFTLSFVDSK